MRRFIFHHNTNTVPQLSVDFECVQFSNKQVVVALKDKVLHFFTLEVMVRRFESNGTVEIEWIDEEVTE